MNKIKAAFFDRDDTLIRDVGYLSSLDQIEIIPSIIKLCKILQDEGFVLFVITNQSGVARGFFDEAFVEETHEKLKKMFEQRNIYLKKMYYCPHHPKFATIQKYKKMCSCRKPKPGMLLQAALEFNIDLTRSFMFGDRSLDLEAGEAAGCKSFLVQNLDLHKIKKIEDLYKL